jgi:GT2 family glycosyltransferase
VIRDPFFWLTVNGSRITAFTRFLLNPLVSIIIVNWNGLAHLPDCLDSLAAQTFRDFEVVLVDNGSKDGSVSFVTKRYPWVRVIPLPENTGFATGNNRGFAHSRGDYIVTLNNDTRAESQWLETLVGVADAHPQAGMVGSRICSFSDPDRIDSVGMGVCLDGMSRGRYRNQPWSSLRLKEVEEILFPSACAALYRRTMLEETGFFDDDFFAYAEDSDLGLRGRLSGWDAVLATKAVVYHKYSQTTGSLSPFKVYLVERNHYWVALKNFPLSRLLALPLFTVLRYFEQLRVVLAGRGAGGEFRADGSGRVLVGAFFKGSVDSLRGIPRMLRKRRQIMVKRRMPMREFSEILPRYRISFKELLDDN